MRFSVQGDYVFDRASLFLLRLVCQKKKRYAKKIAQRTLTKALVAKRLPLAFPSGEGGPLAVDEEKRRL